MRVNLTASVCKRDSTASSVGKEPERYCILAVCCTLKLVTCVSKPSSVGRVPPAAKVEKNSRAWTVPFLHVRPAGYFVVSSSSRPSASSTCHLQGDSSTPTLMFHPKLDFQCSPFVDS